MHWGEKNFEGAFLTKFNSKEPLNELKVENTKKVEVKVEEKFDMDKELERAKAEYECELKTLEALEKDDQKPSTITTTKNENIAKAEKHYKIWKDSKQDFTIDVGNQWRVDGVLAPNSTYDLIHEFNQQNLVQAVEVEDVNFTPSDDREPDVPIDDVFDHKHVFHNFFDKVVDLAISRGATEPLLDDFAQFLNDRSSFTTEIYQLYVITSLRSQFHSDKEVSLCDRISDLHTQLLSLKGGVTDDVT